MAIRRWMKLAILAKLETTYGVDPIPTGVANFIQVSNVTFTPLAGDEEARNLIQPFLGHQGVLLTGEYAQLEFDVEIAGAGAAGTAPAYGPLLRACGLSETITAATDVQYVPIHDLFESGAIYYNSDGVRHVLLGARGTFTLSFAPKRIPHLHFTFKGLAGTIADTALPAVTKTMWKDPVVVSKANTIMSLHGWSAIAESLDIVLGATVTPRHLIGEESIEMTERAATGTAVVKATTLAVKDWFSIARAHTRGALSGTHGTAAGNIVAIDADAVQLGRPTEGQSDNIRNYSIPLMLTSLGTTEFKITVK